MNFFKSFASPRKAPTAPSPDVSKDTGKGTREPEAQAKLEKDSAAKAATLPASELKESDPNPKDSSGGAFSKLFRQKSLKETQPTTVNGVQEADTAKAPKPVPPPPEPPKLETKGEPATKTSKSTQKEAAKDIASVPETPTKQKPPKSGPFAKLFHHKTVVENSQENMSREEQQQEVSEQQEDKEEEREEEGQGGASKASTLEAPSTLSEPPKPLEKKKSNLISLFKAKSPESTKDAPPEAPPLPEAAQSPKAKEEPKSSAEAEKKKGSKQEASASKAKAPEVTAENRSAPEPSHSGDDSAVSISKKLEKRNSIHLFFKSLGPKRLSEASVQTDPVTITYPSEKSK